MHAMARSVACVQRRRYSIPGPDLGQEVDDALLRYERRSISRAIGDAFVACQTSQAVIVRANGVARVALPEISGFIAFGNAIAGIVADRAHVSLLVVPLPESGEHDLELVPTASRIPNRRQQGRNRPGLAYSFNADE